MPRPPALVSVLHDASHTFPSLLHEPLCMEYLNLNCGSVESVTQTRRTCGPPTGMHLILLEPINNTSVIRYDDDMEFFNVP